MLIIEVSISGCKKFVQVPAPYTQLVPGNVFNSSSTATAALTDIYQQMYANSESFNMALDNGLLSDELTNYSAASTFVQYYQNSMSAIGGYCGPWIHAYNYIYQANAIIQGLQNNNAIVSSINSQLTGEAKFIRAFWNFYLVYSYGDVPLTTTVSYIANQSLSRTPKNQVISQIISDLKDAQNLLNTNFVDASDTTVTNDRIRPTKWAATALLARTYLYNGDFANAEAQASAVIGNTGQFSLVNPLNQVFLMNSNEAIWQLGIPGPYTNINTIDGFNFILQSAPTGGQPYAISPQLLNAFEPGDNRRTTWINSYINSTPPIDTFYYPFKYQVYTSSTISEYTMMLRLAEQYLIRAEARAQGAGIGLTGAISDLDSIRVRAGLPSYSGLMSSSAVLDAIYHERQVELFTEWGQRWFDLVRSGRANTVLGPPGNVCKAKGGTWNSNSQLFPISQAEIIADPNLTQNPGY